MHNVTCVEPGGIAMVTRSNLGDIALEDDTPTKTGQRMRHPKIHTTRSSLVTLPLNCSPRQRMLLSLPRLTRAPRNNMNYRHRHSLSLAHRPLILWEATRGPPRLTRMARRRRTARRRAPGKRSRTIPFTSQDPRILLTTRRQRWDLRYSPHPRERACRSILD